MSTTTAQQTAVAVNPIALVAGQQLNLTPPNPYYVGAVLSNLSPLRLKVFSAAGTWWLEPFTSDFAALDPSRGAIYVTPSAYGTGFATPSQLGVTWYAQPPPGYPQSLQAVGISAAIQGAVTVQSNAEALLNVTVPNGHATTPYTINPNPWDHALHVGWDSGAAVADFTIKGNSSNIVYYNGTIMPGQSITVPIDGAIDTSCSVSIGLNYGAFTGGVLTIAGEPTPSLVNVSVQASTGAGATTALPVNTAIKRFSATVAGAGPATMTLVSGIAGFRVICGTCSVIIGTATNEIYVQDTGGSRLLDVTSTANQQSYTQDLGYAGANGGTIQAVFGAAGNFRATLVYDFWQVF